MHALHGVGLEKREVWKKIKIAFLLFVSLTVYHHEYSGIIYRSIEKRKKKLMTSLPARTICEFCKDMRESSIIKVNHKIAGHIRR